MTSTKFLLSAVFLAGAIGFQTSAKAESLIKVDGSSTVFPITEGVSEEFQKEMKQTKVTVGVSGTGGGFKKFCRGETDLQNASRPISKEEMEACRKEKVEYFELPIAFDAIAIVVNKKNTWISEITIDELKKMWEPDAQAKIMTWDQVNPKWPKEKLVLLGASPDNGTFDYFTEAVMGKSKSCRGDYTASVDHNTRVTGVGGNKSSLGFMPFSYYIQNKDKLKLLGVVGGDKAPKKTAVLPSEQSVIDGTYYPLSRPLFIYANKKSLDRMEVKKFVEFYLKSAGEITKQVQYVPLPDKAYKTAQDHVAKNRVGTIYRGEPHVGMTIEEIMKKEAAM